MERCHEALGHHSQRWPPVLLDLILVEQRDPFPQEVQYSKRQTKAKVAGEGKDDGQKGR